MSTAQPQMSETDAFDAGERSGPLELSTCGEDVATARAPYKGRDPGFAQRHLERVYRLIGRCGVWDFRAWIPRDQVHFGTGAAQQLNEFAGVSLRIIHPTQ